MAQELNEKMMKPLPAGSDLVRPADLVTVYATRGKHNKHVKEGEAMEVHTLLADKLIASGKATKTAPAGKKDK
jgi:hypothetical protein